jgi:hypothetical protein
VLFVVVLAYAGWRLLAVAMEEGARDVEAPLRPRGEDVELTLAVRRSFTAGAIRGGRSEVYTMRFPRVYLLEEELPPVASFDWLDSNAGSWVEMRLGPDAYLSADGEDRVKADDAFREAFFAEREKELERMEQKNKAAQLWAEDIDPGKAVKPEELPDQPAPAADEEPYDYGELPPRSSSELDCYLVGSTVNDRWGLALTDAQLDAFPERLPRAAYASVEYRNPLMPKRGEEHSTWVEIRLVPGEEAYVAKSGTLMPVKRVRRWVQTAHETRERFREQERKQREAREARQRAEEERIRKEAERAERGKRLAAAVWGKEA